MNRLTPLLMLAVLVSLALPAGANPDALRENAQDRVAHYIAQQGAQPDADVKQTLRAHWRADLVGPSMLLGLYVPAAGETAKAKAQSWLNENADLFALTSSDLRFASQTNFGHRTAVTFKQVHNGQPVHHRSLVVTVDRQSGLVTRVVNNTFPVFALRAARHGNARAIALAKFKSNENHQGEGRLAANATPTEHVKKVIIASPAGAFEAALVQVAPNPGELRVLEVVVDLNRGEVASLRSNLKR